MFYMTISSIIISSMMIRSTVIIKRKAE